jgi:hypothetical protein
MSVSRVRCFLLGHRWQRVRYDGADTSDEFFLRCRRCATENHDESNGLKMSMAWAFRQPGST